MQYNDIKAKYLSAMCHTFHYILIQINLLHKVQKSVSPAAKIRRVQTRGNLIREVTCLIYTKTIYHFPSIRVQCNPEENSTLT